MAGAQTRITRLEPIHARIRETPFLPLNLECIENSSPIPILRHHVEPTSRSATGIGLGSSRARTRLPQ